MRNSPYDSDIKGALVIARLVEWLNAKWEMENAPAPHNPSQEAVNDYWQELEKALNAYVFRVRPLRHREAVEWNGTVYVFRPYADDSWELQDEIGLTI